MSYPVATFHMRKIKSLSGLIAAWQHNSRQENELIGREVPQVIYPNHANRHLGPEDIRQVAPLWEAKAGARMPLSLGLDTDPAERGFPMPTLKRLLAGANVSPDLSMLRKNAVLAVEFVFIASPGWFRPHEEEEGDGCPIRVRQFFEQSSRWSVSQFGRTRLLRLDLHADERSVHAHALVIPIWDAPTAGNRELGPRLAARELFGGFSKAGLSPLTGLLDSYALAMAPLGLVRGLVGSTAEHGDFRSFKAIEARRMRETTAANHRANAASVAAEEARLRYEARRLVEGQRQAEEARKASKGPRKAKVEQRRHVEESARSSIVKAVIQSQRAR